MSDYTKEIITRLGAVVAILVGLFSLFSVWVILPYRMDAAERAISDVQVRTLADHALLQRIDERTARIERALEHAVRE